ncbi:MAG: hypothetical protein ACOY4L_10815 [Pseudomonadota bacterium]
MNETTALNIIAVMLLIFMLVAAAAAFLLWRAIQALEHLLRRAERELAPRACEVQQILSRARQFSAEASYRARRFEQVTHSVGSSTERLVDMVTLPAQKLGAASVLAFIANRFLHRHAPPGGKARRLPRLRRR